MNLQDDLGEIIFKSSINENEYKTGNKAASQPYKDLGTPRTCNWWQEPRNEEGLNPDQIIERKLKLEN